MGFYVSGGLFEKFDLLLSFYVHFFIGDFFSLEDLGYVRNLTGLLVKRFPSLREFQIKQLILHVTCMHPLRIMHHPSIAGVFQAALALQRLSLFGRGRDMAIVDWAWH